MGFWQAVCSYRSRRGAPPASKHAPRGRIPPSFKQWDRVPSPYLLPAALWIIGGLGIITIIQRMVVVRRQLRP